MFPWLLNLAYVALLIAVSPWLVFRAFVRRKYLPGWREKLWGAVPLRNSPSPCLWLHAVSVGEVLQLQPVLEGLIPQLPGYEFVISTTTLTAYEVAVKRYPAQRVLYWPLDFTWAVHRALDRIRPTAVLLVELELWPNFILAATRRQIPVLLINGRISERSFRGYQRIRPLVAQMLRRLALCAVQNETYAQRLRELGAPLERIHVTGSIKFDRVETDRHNLRTRELRTQFGFQPDERVFIAGSTQAPEERAAIEAFLAVHSLHPQLRLVLVPRHKERFEEVARLVTETYGLPLFRRSAGRWSSSPAAGNALPGVWLLDTLGELSACWGLADFAFVGGSLSTRGGQNMMEPAGYGAAVCFGPNTQNFRDVVLQLLAADAAVVVRDGPDLQRQLLAWLNNPAMAQACGARARDLVVAQRGATATTIQLVRETLPVRHGAATPHAA